MAKKYDRQMILVNIFGAIGYMLLVTVWTLFAALIVSLALQGSATMAPIEVVDEGSTHGLAPPSPVIVVAGYIIAIVFATLSLAILITLPYFLAKWGGRLLRRSMRLLRVEPTRRYLFLTKSLLAVLPLAGMTIMNFVMQSIDQTFAVIHLLATGLGAAAIISFFVQLLLARKFKIPADKAW